MSPLLLILQKAEFCKGDYTSLSRVHGKAGTKGQAKIILGLGDAGIGSSQRQSGGTSRARRSRRMRRSRQRGRPGRQSRRCRSSWRASGGRQPSGALAGAQPAALLEVCCESAPHGGTASLHRRDCLCACLALQDWLLIHVLLVMSPTLRLCRRAKAAYIPCCACMICGLAVRPDIIANKYTTIEYYPPTPLACI